MKNLLSYCGLVDAKIRASDKDLPVNIIFLSIFGLTFDQISRKGGQVCKFSLDKISAKCTFVHPNAPLCISLMALLVQWSPQFEKHQDLGASIVQA